MNDFTRLVNLRGKDLRKEGLFVAEGRLLVERSLSSGCEVLGIIADAAAADDARELAGSGIPVSVCESDGMDLIAGFPFHRGMLAVVKRPDPVNADTGESLSGRILVLPAITDPGNLGTLLRSALAFGFNSVFLGSQTCDPFNRKALRASMGAALKLSLNNAGPESLAGIAAAGAPVYAAAMEEGALVAGGADFPDLADKAAGGKSPLPGPALVLGNEYDAGPRIQPGEQEGMERLARYIIRASFSHI